MAKVKIQIMQPADFFYAHVDPRRRQEIADARMIREDHSKIANLSEKAIHQQFNPDRFRFDSMKAAVPPYENEVEMF